MKKKNLKKISILLTLTTLLTACGSPAKDDNNTAKPTTNTNSSKKQEETNTSNNLDFEFTEMDAYESLTYDDVACPEPYPEPYIEPTEELSENKFIKTSEHSTSTFSADVDTASYSYIRDYINSGFRIDDIDKSSVRIEEMINYFSYNYESPDSEDIFNVTTQATKCPWNPENDLVMIGLNTEKIDLSETPDSNLVFLLDVSGSMNSSDKLPLLMKSFSLLVNELDENDKVSIVTYAGSDEVLLNGVSGGDKETILSVLNNLEASGSTNGGDGIITAYELAQEHFIENGINRVILATDGDLNVGLTSEEELEELITEKKETGVFLTTLGFGNGNYRDNNLELLADKGNGNYAYIDSINEAKKVLVNELGSTFNTVAKDVKLQVEFNPDIVEEYRLIGYENRVMANEDFTDDTKDAGEIGSGHCVTALYEIKTKEQTDDIFSLKIRYKNPDEDVSKEIEHTPSSLYTTSPSKDFNFIMSVAEFGMLLKDSEYKGNSNFEDIIMLAQNGGADDDTVKAEYLELVKKASK